MKDYLRIQVASFGKLAILILLSVNQLVIAQQTDAQDQKTSTSPTNLLQSSQSSWNIQTKIGTIVADRPATARILELVGIDYCCGGQKTLAVAAKENNIDEVQLLNALLVVGEPGSTSGRNWLQAPLNELTEHIVATHHGWLRRNLPSLLSTTETVRRVHGDAHPELAKVESTLAQISAAVIPHLDEEEKHLFPEVEKLVKGEHDASPKLSKMLESMHDDHDDLGILLHQLRDLTDGFRVPRDACAKYREMLTGLAKLERDMLQHVHLENNVLLPRVLKLLKSENP